MTIFIVNCHYSGGLHYCKFRMMNGCWNISQFKRSSCTWISSIRRSFSIVGAITCDHAIVIQIANAWSAQPTMHHEQWIFGFGIVRFGLFLNRQHAWSSLSDTHWTEQAASDSQCNCPYVRDDGHKTILCSLFLLTVKWRFTPESSDMQIAVAYGMLLWVILD